jgi:hypothetical protein
LATQEHVLGLDGLGRPKQQDRPAQGVLNQNQCNPDKAEHGDIVPQRPAGGYSAHRPSADAKFAEHSYENRTPQAAKPE